MKKHQEILFIVSALIVALLALLLPFSQWFSQSYLLNVILRIMGVLIVVAVVLYWLRLFNAMERVRHQIIALGLNPLNGEIPSQTEFNDREMVGGVKQLKHSIYRLLDNQQKQFYNFQSNFASILDSIADCVIVINNIGIITMCNHLAQQTIKQDISVGNSVFSLFDRRKLAKILQHFLDDKQQSKAYKTELTIVNGNNIKVRITQIQKKQGFVICFTSQAIKESEPLQLYYDFSLHRPIPEKIIIDPQTSINDLIALVIDTETTGLNVKKDAVISFGSVFCMGSDIYPNQTIELLIKPDKKLTAKSMEIHHITPKQLANKDNLVVHWMDKQTKLQHCLNEYVLVGHNIGFDLAVIKNNLHRYNIDWQPQYYLDTLYLTYSLLPDRNLDWSLDSIIDYFQIPSLGRHTALGDALMTSNVFTRLLVIAEEKGDKTFADLLARQNSVKAFKKQNKQLGWII